MTDNTDNSDSPTSSGFNRRTFIAGAAGTAITPITARGAGAATNPQVAQDASLPVDVTLHINGASKPFAIDARTTLLDALREHLGLTGSKKGCDHGQCGACTVLLDGRRVLACLTLALATEGQQVLTIEGLAKGDDLHPMQLAFIDQDAFQCGYCTPGQIMSAVACVKEGHAGSDDDIREYMSGPFFVPPLRDRKEDIPLFARHFLKDLAATYGRRPREITDDAVEALMRYSWPGNVRELRNVIERIVIMNPMTTRFDRKHLPPLVYRDGHRRAARTEFSTLHQARDAYERDFILKKLDENHGNVTRAAEVLGLERSHLYRKMKTLGIAVKE